MTHNVGIWIDHTKAVIVNALDATPSAATIASDLGPDAHFSGRAHNVSPDGAQENRGERRTEAHRRLELDRYYDEVIARMGAPDELLIMGPGEAKHELKRRMGHVKALASVKVALDTTDKLRDNEIVDLVKAHFAVAR